MKKYYFKIIKTNEKKYGADIFRCAEICKVLNNGTMIGSMSCTDDCKYCIDHNNWIDKGKGWIKCSKLKEAIG